jgi:hypothetical protein
MKIFNEKGLLVEPSAEGPEKELAQKYIKKTDRVLELGARYGSVSCLINNILSNQSMHVAVEPDFRVWGPLEYNKMINDCKFYIHKGFLSSTPLSLKNIDQCDGGYGSTSFIDSNSKLPIVTVHELEDSINCKFNVLVADCEGCLESFFKDNPFMYDQLRMIIFEGDYPDSCDYTKIINELSTKGFSQVFKSNFKWESLPKYSHVHKNLGHQNVWAKC